MRHDIAGECAHHGLRVFNLAIEHGIDQLLHVHEVDVQELVFVGRGAFKRKLRRKVQMDELRPRTRRNLQSS